MPYERHAFRQLAPMQGQKDDKFMVRLRKQACHCNFGESLNENLRDQLIEKLVDVELKKKLLEFNNITLEAALDKVRKWKAWREQAQQMITPNQEPGTSTNVVGKPREMDPKGTCFNGGQEGHFARDRSCLARGQKCAKCDKHGHYASCCKGGKSYKPGKQSTSQKLGGRQGRPGKGRQANFVKGRLRTQVRMMHLLSL